MDDPLRAQVRRWAEWKAGVLILIVMDDPLRAHGRRANENEFLEVLILIVMDDPLRVAKHATDNYEPYES